MINFHAAGKLEIIPFPLALSKSRFRMRAIVPRSLLAALLAVPASANAAQPIETATTNLAPLAQIHGLPILDARAITGDNHSIDSTSRTARFSLTANIASVSQEFVSNNESLLLDGEINRIDLAYKQRIGWLDSYTKSIGLSSTTISLNIPYIHHSQGFMDSTIETWHDWFGLPNSNRALRPDNALQYSYISNGNTLLDFRNEANAFGDATLQIAAVAARRESSNQRLHISTGVKLPTGDELRLTGSGAADLYTAITLENPIALDRWRLEWFVTGYYMRIHPSGPLASQVNDELLAGKIQLAGKLSPKWRLFAQFDYHEALHRSEIEALGDDTLVGTFGVERKLGKNRLIIQLSEDLFVDNSHDAAFGVALSRNLANR